MTISHDVENCRKCFYLRILAVLLWTVGLVIVSLLPGGKALYFFSGQDKLLHFTAYLLTALLACRMLQVFSFSIRKIIYISVTYCIILGGLLELLQQSLTASRHAEWYDFLANSAGAVSGCVIFCLYLKLSSKHHEEQH